MITTLTSQNIIEKFDYCFKNDFASFEDTDEVFIITVKPASISGYYYYNEMKKQLKLWGFDFNGSGVHKLTKKVHSKDSKTIPYSKLIELQFNSLVMYLIPSFVDSNGNVDSDKLIEAMKNLEKGWGQDIEQISKFHNE